MVYEPKKSIKGYLNSFWSGVSTIQLAKFINFSIQNNITGLYHLTNGNKINKYELLKLFNTYALKDIRINPYENIFSDKSFLDSRKLYDLVPSYKIMVAELFKFIKENNHLYPHYSE